MGLYQIRKRKAPVFIYMPLTNKCISNFYAHSSDNSDEEVLRQQGMIPDYCFNQSDYRFLEELRKLRALRILLKESGFDTDINWYARIQINNPLVIERVYQWMQDDRSKRILHYGIFSLNLYTGEAYCKDNQYIFDPHRGMFKIFKAFLENKKHELSYEEIYAINQNKAKEETGEVDSAIKLTAQQNIGDIKERLSMKGELAKLFVPTGMSYMLHPGLD